jgi:CDGSH-type Zn-finger protein/truncated hemoglobin YjbI
MAAVNRSTGIRALLEEARALALDSGRRDGGDGGGIADRLERSVIRPLEGADDAGDSAGPARTATGSPEQRLVKLAERATRLRSRRDAPLGLLEATAALQELAAGIDSSALAVHERLQSKLPSAVTVVPNGPYLVTNVAKVADWLGVPVDARPQLALCRCGQSKLKPLCDGTHAEIGFTDEKDPHRVPDRRDTYEGVQVTVLDNRGLCAHSGFCSDRLRSVFHAGSEPFVTPSGGRLDEIVQAVRACPSGALSYAIDGREAREQVDQQREPAIEVSKDGPYRITGGVPLLDANGEPVARNEGASLEHYSLCRCGKSQNKPFCSGMHWYASFRDPEPPADREPTLFEWAGGFPALLRMTRIFYGKYVPEEPLLAPLFANMSPDHPDRVAAWLGEVFGGPPAYSDRYGGYTRMIGQHLGKALTEEQRARWVQLLCRSADDAMLPDDPEFRAAFVAYLEWGSRVAKENSTPGAHPPPNMPMPRWWWVCDAYPDARVSALAPTEEEQPVSLPGPDEPISFAANIKPLFRDRDRQSMRFAFDLWAYDDVAANAEPILERLRAGTMPCDGAWPAERVAVFERWADSGKPA